MGPAFAGPNFLYMELAIERLMFAGMDSLANGGTPRRVEDALELRSIEAVKSGRGDAYDYLVAKYTKRVVSIAWGLVRNAHDAEDLAQEAFVKAYETIGRFKTGEPFGPWIFRIVTNLSLDVLKHRRRVRQEELSDTQPAARRDSADLPAVSHEIGSRARKRIQSLAEIQRIVAPLPLVQPI